MTMEQQLRGNLLQQTKNLIDATMLYRSATREVFKSDARLSPNDTTEILQWLEQIRNRILAAGSRV